MRVLYLLVDETGPSLARIEHRLGYGRTVLPEGWELAVDAIEVAPPHYEESAVGLALAVPGILRAVRRASTNHDAAIIGCYGDPGLRAARALARIPVVGPGEASVTLARLSARRFGLLTIARSNVPELELSLEAHDGTKACAGIEAIGITPEAVLDEPDLTEVALERAGDRLIALGAEALILGCMSFAFHPFATRLGERMGIPVIDPLRASIAVLQATETLAVRLGPASPSIQQLELWTRIWTNSPRPA